MTSRISIFSFETLPSDLVSRVFLSKQKSFITRSFSYYYKFHLANLIPKYQFKFPRGNLNLRVRSPSYNRLIQGYRRWSSGSPVISRVRAFPDRIRVRDTSVSDVLLAKYQGTSGRKDDSRLNDPAGYGLSGWAGSQTHLCLTPRKSLCVSDANELPSLFLAHVIDHCSRGERIQRNPMVQRPDECTRCRQLLYSSDSSASRMRGVARRRQRKG